MNPSKSIFWRKLKTEPYYVGLFIHFGVSFALSLIFLTEYLIGTWLVILAAIILSMRGVYKQFYRTYMVTKYKLANDIPITLDEAIHVNDDFNKEEEKERREDPWYDVVIHIFHFFHYANFFGILFALASTQSYILAIIFGMVWGYGYSGIMIAFSHEFIHRRSLFLQMLGGSLWSFFCYGTFLAEHCMVHHVHVSTPLDASSARKNQTLYEFLPRAIAHNAINGFKAEANRLRERGKSPWSVYNRLIWLSLLSVIVFFAAYLIAGVYGVVFFVIQTVLSILKIEVANYFMHYGLERRLMENGKYERVSPLHSWNIEGYDHFTVINVSRHSDHHAFPRRPYQVLRNFPDAPQLPLNFAQALFLPYFPSIWFGVMNPKVDEHMAKLQKWREENKDDYQMVMGFEGRAEM